MAGPVQEVALDDEDGPELAGFTSAGENLDDR